MLNKYIGPLTWAWIIILGALMILPGGIITCIKCGAALNILIGVVSIALGVAGFAMSRSEMATHG